MDGVVREVDEEWLCAVLFDEVDRLAGKAVSEIFALRSVGQVWEFIRAEVGWRRALFAAAEVEVEALVFGPMLGRIAEVPFSEECRFVAAVPQCLGKGEFPGGQKRLNRGALQCLVRLVLAPWQPVRDAQAGWIFSGQDAGACWRADRRGGIGIGEAHALLSQVVKVRGLVKCAPVAAEVRPSEIIGEDEDDVWLFLCGSRVECAGCSEEEGDEGGFHKKLMWNFKAL